MNENDVKNCIGCKNIESENFPFIKQAATGKKGFWIDTEGCGIVQNKDDYYLKIYYCPVCGNSLTKKGKRDGTK